LIMALCNDCVYSLLRARRLDGFRVAHKAGSLRTATVKEDRNKTWN